MDITKETVTLKTKMYGWTVDKTTEYLDGRKTGVWYELIDTYDPDSPIYMAFRWKRAAERWARKHRNYKCSHGKNAAENGFDPIEILTDPDVYKQYKLHGGV